MAKISKKKLIELFRSGDFTIVYWDSGEPTIYRGKWNYNKEFERDDYETMNKAIVKYPMYYMGGYVPDIVALLAEALKGKTDSI